MSKKKYRKVCRQWIAWLLCIAVLFQSVPVYAGETKETYGESQIKTTGQEESVMDSEKAAPQEENFHTELLENGVIKLYNQEQLKAVGSGREIRTGDIKEETFGQGEPLVLEGQTVTYAVDGTYQMMNVLWSSIFVTLMANKIGGLQFNLSELSDFIKGVSHRCRSFALDKS